MGTSRNGTILVVDDEEIMREILETLLTREGYDVRLATSGAEGLELARALPFDAAIVDIMMPGLDGIATLDELKRIDEDLAVIIITAYASVESAIVTVHSGSLPPDLLESTVFGDFKGAFTGAVYPKKGLFDLADKGSIFFDEIGNVPLETQAKLLRVIQERDFMRLGGMETIKVDVRIIAATNVDLRQMMEEGRFREDLFYRLHVISIQLPPLRDRKDDIPLLVQHFLQKYGEENHRKADLEVTPEALDLMTDYDWPGNVRELENVIERAVVLTSRSRIGVDLIPDHVRKVPNFHMPPFVVPPEGISFKNVITDFEKRLIESTLEVAGGVQKRAAELLHIKPTTLNEMIKRHDIRPRRKRSGTGQPVEDGPEPEAAGELAGPIGRS